MTSAAKFGATASFLDVDDIIEQTVIFFMLKYGGDQEELRAEANLHFLYAYERYDRQYQDFDKWVKFIVSKRLLETLRKQVYRNNRLARNYLDMERVRSPEEFNMLEFLEELSSDGKTVMHYLLGEPTDLRLAIARKGDSPKEIKKALRSILQDLDWEEERINEAFAEIREAL